LLYAMEDVAVYGYMTPLKMKIILALALADGVVRDADIVMVRVRSAYIPNRIQQFSFHIGRFSKHFILHMLAQSPILFLSFMLRPTCLTQVH